MEIHIYYLLYLFYQQSMPKNIHQKLKVFLVQNLLHKINSKPFYTYYNAFSKEKWNTDKDLLKTPTSIKDESNTFLQIVQESVEKELKWFVCSRKVGLSDSNFQRAMNAIRNRHLSVQLGENTKIDLGILNYLTEMNKNQLNVKVDHYNLPIINSHTARLMRELYILKKEYNIPYKIRPEQQQLKVIVNKWFNDNYVLDQKKSIGYPRRKLLEECNDFLVHEFGDSRIMYCHDPVWRWLLKEIINVNDTEKNTSYLRLPVWKKNTSNGNIHNNTRKSSGPAGEYTLEQRQLQRTKKRKLNAREKDANRKKQENDKKKKQNI